MQAVEFEIDAENDVIRIPKQYKMLYSKHLKVVAMFEDQTSTEITSDQSSRKLAFDSVKLKTKGFKFNREEAHAR